jgi:hypothetical protein
MERMGASGAACGDRAGVITAQQCGQKLKSELTRACDYRKFDPVTGLEESGTLPRDGEWLKQMACVLSLRFKSRARLEAENLVLRQQLNVLIRKLPKRLALKNSDRLLLVWLYRLFPSVLSAIRIVRPETVIHWHRRGFRAYLALEIAPRCRPTTNRRQDS